MYMCKPENQKVRIVEHSQKVTRKLYLKG